MAQETRDIFKIIAEEFKLKNSTPEAINLRTEMLTAWSRIGSQTFAENLLQELDQEIALSTFAERQANAILEIVAICDERIVACTADKEYINRASSLEELQKCIPAGKLNESLGFPFLKMMFSNGTAQELCHYIDIRRLATAKAIEDHYVADCLYLQIKHQLLEKKKILTNIEAKDPYYEVVFYEKMVRIIKPFATSPAMLFLEPVYFDQFIIENQNYVLNDRKVLQKIKDFACKIDLSLQKITAYLNNDNKIEKNLRDRLLKQTREIASKIYVQIQELMNHIVDLNKKRMTLQDTGVNMTTRTPSYEMPECYLLQTMLTTQVLLKTIGALLEYEIETQTLKQAVENAKKIKPSQQLKKQTPLQENTTTVQKIQASEPLTQHPYKPLLPLDKDIKRERIEPKENDEYLLFKEQKAKELAEYKERIEQERAARTESRKIIVRELEQKDMDAERQIINSTSIQQLNLLIAQFSKNDIDFVTELLQSNKREIKVAALKNIVEKFAHFLKSEYHGFCFGSGGSHFTIYIPNIKLDWPQIIRRGQEAYQLGSRHTVTAKIWLGINGDHSATNLADYAIDRCKEAFMRAGITIDALQKVLQPAPKNRQ